MPIDDLKKFKGKYAEKVFDLKENMLGHSVKAHHKGYDRLVKSVDPNGQSTTRRVEIKSGAAKLTKAQRRSFKRGSEVFRL